jgi:hypothetical protein
MGLEDNLERMPVRKAKSTLRRLARVVMYGEEYIARASPVLVGIKTREGMLTHEGYAAGGLLEVNQAYSVCKKLIAGVLHDRPSAWKLMRQVTFAYDQLCEDWAGLWK